MYEKLSCLKTRLNIYEYKRRNNGEGEGENIKSREHAYAKEKGGMVEKRRKYQEHMHACVVTDMCELYTSQLHM